MRFTGLDFERCLRDPEWCARYQAWMADPMTADMLGFAERAAQRLGAPPKIDGDHALHYSGISTGAQLILDFLTSIPRRAEQVGKASALEVAQDFGANALLTEAGYTPDVLKKAGEKFKNKKEG